MARRIGRVRTTGQELVSRRGGVGNVSTLVGRKAGIANNTATSIIRVTVPNGNHNAAIKIRLMAHLGAGTDASESTRYAEGAIVIARQTGATAVAVAIALQLAGIATAAAGGTLTLAYSVTAMTGAVGAVQTFDIQVTAVVTGTITNHVVTFSAELMNSAEGGVTMAAV